SDAENYKTSRRAWAPASIIRRLIMAKKLDETASGVYVIAVTPFTDEGALDEKSIDQVVEFYLEKGVAGITILGMMGESHKITPEEARTTAQRYLKRVDNRVPVVVGISNAGTDP